ncbi:MAG: histidine phosphatase family protein [Bacteroidetes bacterium]|nr:histidine phosphatase family protein [Bacteroidota bacterium]MBS1932044.1 histidine phosphatase family protein [Bacteroidota bacterium]
MKTLLLIRHAKSSWDDAALSDFDRPLNERGKKDAPMMAKRLSEKKIKIDAFISSPAKRAARTAKYFAEEFKSEKDDILFKTELYLASANVFYDIIRKADDKLDCIAIFSHNPGITEFANELTEVHIDNIPTCGIFAVKADIKLWPDFKDAKRKFLFFDYPKS